MRSKFTVLVIAAMSLPAISARAQLTSPLVGWQAELNRIYHNVGGTVTIVDDNTLKFDNFTFDGAGLDVRFYLGTSDTQTAFASGLPIGPQLLGMSYDGSQPPFVVDMPPNQTLEGWHAISVWCVTARANFGSGSFAPPPGDFNEDGRVDAADYTTWRDGLGSAYEPADYDIWKAHFGTPSTAGSTGGGAEAPSLSAAIVPEPAMGTLLAILIIFELPMRLAVAGVPSPDATRRAAIL